MKKKRGNYPSTVFIARRELNDDDDITAHDDIAEYVDGIEVGVYQLVSIGTVKKTATLAEVKAVRRR